MIARGQVDRRADPLRVRARAVSAATQRRDSINSQLTNVRQMLATLTGASLPDPLGDIEPTDQADARPPRATQGRARGQGDDKAAAEPEAGPDKAPAKAQRREVPPSHVKTPDARPTASDAGRRLPGEALADQALTGGDPRVSRSRRRRARSTARPTRPRDEARRSRAPRRERAREADAADRGACATVRARRVRTETEDDRVRPARPPAAARLAVHARASSARSGSSSPGSSSRRSSQARSVIVLIVVALFLAIGLNPVVEWLTARGLRRGWRDRDRVLRRHRRLRRLRLRRRPAGRRAEQRSSSRSCPTTWQDLRGNPTSASSTTTTASSSGRRTTSRPATWDSALFGGIVGVGRVVLNAVFSAFSLLIMTLYFLAALPSMKRQAYRLVPAPAARAGDAAQRRGHQPDRRLRQRCAVGRLHRRAHVVHLPDDRRHALRAGAGRVRRAAST